MAQAFLDSTKSRLQVRFLENKKYFPDDKTTRNVWEFKLSRGKREYVATFGDSFKNSGTFFQTFRYKHWHDVEGEVRPSVYDILSCLDGSAENFDGVDDMAEEFGIERVSDAVHTWEMMQAELNGLKALYNDEELQQLREIA